MAVNRNSISFIYLFIEKISFSAHRRMMERMSYADRTVLYLAKPHQQIDPRDEFAKEFLPCPWSTLTDQLRKTGAVIGGSVALRFFSYIPFQPSDLDIYGSLSFFPSWERFLKSQGFCILHDETEYERYCRGMSKEAGIIEFRHKVTKFKIQYIHNHKADDVDNTANECTISHEEAVCPHYNQVRENTTTFRVNNQERIVKMATRGFKVKLVNPIVKWFLDFCNKGEVRERRIVF